MDGGNVWGYLFLFSLVALGLRKMWGIFDTGGKVKTTLQDGLAAKIKSWLS